MEGEVKSSVDSVISEEMDGGNVGHVQDALRFHRMSWSFILIHGFDDSEVTLVTSFSLLSKSILDLFQIKWASH